MTTQSDLNELERTFQPLVELLKDSLSEITRKRQSHLMMASIGTILISLKLLTPSTMSIVGVQGEIHLPKNTIISLGIMCTYFLFAFLLSLYQDFRIYKYSNETRRSELGEVSRALLNLLELKSQRIKTLMAESLAILTKTNEASAKIRELELDFDRQYQETDPGLEAELTIDLKSYNTIDSQMRILRERSTRLELALEAKELLRKQNLIAIKPYDDEIAILSEKSKVVYNELLRETEDERLVAKANLLSRGLRDDQVI